jgi:hypothetical protein
MRVFLPLQKFTENKMCSDLQYLQNDSCCEDCNTGKKLVFYFEVSGSRNELKCGFGILTKIELNLSGR